MAVRGLGCPVRFILTAGQKGDALQAAALIEELPAEVIMADTAYDADHLRQAIAAKGALAVIPKGYSCHFIRLRWRLPSAQAIPEVANRRGGRKLTRHQCRW